MTGVAWRWRTALWFVAGCHYWHGIRFKWVRLESNFSSLSSFPSPRPPETTGETIDGGVSFAFEVAALFHSIPYYRLRNRTFCACYMLSAQPFARRVSHALAHRIGRLRNESDWCRPRVWSGRWPRVVSVRPSHPSRRSIMQSAPLAREAFTTRICTDDCHCVVQSREKVLVCGCEKFLLALA